MGKKLKVEDSTRRAAPGRVIPKRQLSRWERERRRRRIVAVVVVVVIVAVLGLIGYGYYDARIKPWHQPIVKINDKVYDMSYFVKMLHTLQLYGYTWWQNTSQDIQYASYVVDIIKDNELKRQAAEEFGIAAIDDTNLEDEIKNFFSFDPETEDEAAFNKRVKEILESCKLSRADFKKMVIEPRILGSKLLEYIGDLEYPEHEEYEHVQVKAVLLGTKEDALEARDKWDEGIDQLVEEYSPSRHYPEDSVEWLPLGIENSAIFENYAFNDESVGSGVSEPIRDTTYSTMGGYWLVMVLEKEGEGEEEELYIQGILLDSESEAEKVAGEFDGDNFAELAQEYSLHSSSKDNGGDMGLLDLDTVKSRFGEDNLSNILALGLNELSDPFYAETSKQSGYWLIEVLASKDRTLIDDHSDILVSDAYNNWLEEKRNSEENDIVNYLDDENGYEKILWALEHI